MRLTESKRGPGSPGKIATPAPQAQVNPWRGPGRPRKASQPKLQDGPQNRGRGRPKGTGKPLKPKLDFRVGLDKPQTAMGQRQPKSAPAARGSLNNKSLASNIYIDREKLELVDSIQEDSSARDLKSQIKLKELKFIQLFLLGGLTIDKAMILAGYGDYHQKSRYRLGRKIVERYESQSQDHRKIFRAIGAGEVAVAQGLLEIAQGPYPADVRRKAWADIASCLGLKSEVVESFQGMSIIIRGEDDADQGQTGDGQPSTGTKPAAAIKAVQIIK